MLVFNEPFKFDATNNIGLVNVLEHVPQKPDDQESKIKSPDKRPFFFWVDIAAVLKYRLNWRLAVAVIA